MKPRYKIGTFVEFTRDGSPETGVIEAQVILSENVRYQMKDQDLNLDVSENDIITAYRPIVARKAKAVKKVAASKKGAPAKSVHVAQ